MILNLYEDWVINMIEILLWVKVLNIFDVIFILFFILGFDIVNIVRFCKFDNVLIGLLDILLLLIIEFLVCGLWVFLILYGIFVLV